MRTLIQRVSEASVTVDGDRIAQIGRGILALMCMEEKDQDHNYDKMRHKLINLRIFEDDNNKMNKSVKDIDGAILLVPQFTLAANTDKGLRPSFSNACPPDIARAKFTDFTTLMQQTYPHIETGRFGADMKVALINDGPVTLWLQS
ncbi:MAG: D-aminoacyl-tRNA deacylase [Francisellaceae bacterium]